ncbi:6126_t:CDS:10 [Ambispora leptoticha]|uniref:6126_t:CDS:1 n=1 Tax=Ambispora leptoticha TaxID=144679 RepID=A0A9N9ADT9_9GLOM|nr:6126_t:CDS:10 [Ambispora leptoticha]
MDPLLFSAPGRIRVLLVPVHPIKASVFQKHVELVKKFGVVKLGDVTPDMRGVQKTMFSAQAFHEGQLHFNFVTHYESEHAYLEEFQMHRKILGVIGIMDCQEWSNLPDGHRKFSEILKTYPTVIAHRCFAFNPAETQPDDTKGLIMIPNVGNMGFYMSTMICDFASDILTEFGNVAAAIEKKSIIDSPKISSTSMLSPHNLPTPQTRHTLPINTSYPVPELKAPPQVPLTPPSTAMTTAAMGGTTPGVSTKDNFYHSRTFSSASLANFASQAAMVPIDIKLKKRTPGRVQKLIADLYLMSGRLPDAVTFYYNAIDTTRNNSDYLWQAAAIEGLCVALILLAYLHADIGPQVLQAPPSPNTNPPSSPSSPVAPKPLWADITEKYLNVITLYAKTSNSAYNQVPPLVYTESCLKLAKMLSSIWVVGQWGDDALKLIVHGGPLPEKGLSEKWGLSQISGVTRVEIAQWTMKGYGAFVEEMSITEQIYITTTMASIFSVINFRRKHAFFLRQTALLILPLLAKPQNSSSQTNLSLEGGDAGILACIAKFTEIYGVGDNVKEEKSDVSHVHEDEPLLNFGWPDIQIDVLKDAISLSEAIPDLPSSIKYTTRLLRKLFLHLPKEEQHRLTISLPRIISSAKKQGLEMDIKYWGMNVVRGIEVCRPTSRKIPYPHSTKIFSMGEEPTEASDTIFIYNPRGKKMPQTVQTHLVANETAYFMVTLANPFAVDLEIQSISISTNGINFKPNVMSTTIPANTSVTLRLSGIPKEAGELVIRGLDSQGSTASTTTTTSTALTTPTQEEHDLDFLKVETIPDQPLIKIKSTSLMHSAIMLFEGEKTEMTIKLENIGKTPVNFINLSFHDSTIENAQNILSSTDLPAEEAYEMELYAYQQPVFYWEPTERKVNLLPNNELILNISVFGKRGCTYGTIQIDYGYIDRPDSVSEAIFFTRQVFYPVLLTVHQHLEPLTMDILNFKPIADNGSSIINNHNGHIDKSTRKQVEELLKITRFNEKSESELDNEYCLLTFDIRNVWHIPFNVTFSVEEVDSPNQVNISTCIQPSATTRIILPIKRISLTENEIMKPIPSLFDKQFVVSKEPKGTKEQERLILSLFWYREFLLKKLTATWECPTGHQKGTIDIRSLRLNKSMLNILRINDISFFVEIQEAPHITKLSLNRFRCPVNEFVHIRFVVFNRQEKPAKLCIRIQPVLSYSDGLMEYDLSGRVVWNGLLQTPLPNIDAKSSTTYTLPVCFFSRGDFQFLYHCEDILTRTMYFDSQPLLVEAVDKNE